MKVRKLKRLCVYCGSGAGVNPVFAEAAAILGGALAKAGVGLVYGGGGNGLMGIVSRECREAGGHVTGIIPTSLVHLENAPDDLDERHVVASLHERKMLMFNMSDGFVALPGGLGTLEELVEQLTWTQLGHHAKPVYIVNTAGYWDLLLALFEQMRSELFIRPGLETHYTLVNDVADVVPQFLKRRSAPRERATGLIGS